MGLGSRFERCDFTPAGICEEYVDVTMLLFHNSIELVQIFQARHVARDRRYVSPDNGCGIEVGTGDDTLVVLHGGARTAYRTDRATSTK